MGLGPRSLILPPTESSVPHWIVPREPPDQSQDQEFVDPVWESHGAQRGLASWSESYYQGLTHVPLYFPFLVPLSTIVKPLIHSSITISEYLSSISDSARVL